MRVLKSAHLGFTITELMIVFSIIAMLTLLSATALQSANKDNMVDEATQQILNGIREAQNRAVGVSAGQEGEKVRVWAIELNENQRGYSLNKYVEETATGGPYLKKINVNTFTFNNNITLNVNRVNSVSTNAVDLPLYIGYNIPFGRSFVTAIADCTCDAVCQNGSDSNSDCNWVKSDRYEQDWGVVPKTDSPIPVISMTENPNDLIKVEVSFSGTTIKKTITITAAGDANVE